MSISDIFRNLQSALSAETGENCPVVAISLRDDAFDGLAREVFPAAIYGGKGSVVPPEWRSFGFEAITVMRAPFFWKGPLPRDGREES